MQSASDTPLSHLWALSCPADQRGVGRGSDRRAHPGRKAVAERSHFGDLDVPKCITSTATLRHPAPISAVRRVWGEALLSARRRFGRCLAKSGKFLQTGSD